jgi:hypothetical protein
MSLQRVAVDVIQQHGPIVKAELHPVAPSICARASLRPISKDDIFVKSMTSCS